MCKRTLPTSLRLISSEGEVFVVETSIAIKLNYIKNMMESIDVTSEYAVPVGHVDKHTLENIFRFVTYSTSMATNRDAKKVSDWKQNFLSMDDSSLFKLIEAANYLDVPELYELACGRVAKMIKELKTPEAIRARFNIENDITPAQHEEIRFDLSFLNEQS